MPKSSISTEAPARRDERRATYRVMPGKEDRLAVSFRTVLGELCTGEVVDISAEGARARFAQALRLPNGSHATLVLHSPHLGGPMELQAVVASTFEAEAQRDYGFRFSPRAQLRGRLSQDLHRLFNRRAACRGAAPDPAERIEVVVHLPGESGASVLGTARLRNISVTGVGILVDPDLDALLSAIERVEISLRLPPSLRTLRLTTWVRYRSAVDNHVCYGLRLDGSRSEDFLGQAEDIAEYMIHRIEAELPHGLH